MYALCPRGDAARFPWERRALGWGDETGSAAETTPTEYSHVSTRLFSRVTVPTSQQCTEVPTVNLSPEQAAARIRTNLKGFYGATRSTRPDALDVTLLGNWRGRSHASLFPGPGAWRKRTIGRRVIGAKKPRHAFNLNLSGARHAAATARTHGDGQASMMSRPRHAGDAGVDGRPALTCRPPALVNRCAAAFASGRWRNEAQESASMPGSDGSVVIVMGVSRSGSRTSERSRRATAGGLPGRDWVHLRACRQMHNVFR